MPPRQNRYCGEMIQERKTREVSSKKYEITDIKHPKRPWVRRIRALRDIPFADVKTGDLGGYVERPTNLSQAGECWIRDDAMVYGKARVYDNAQVDSSAWVHGNARVYGFARVSCSAHVSEDAQVYDEAEVSDSAEVGGAAQVYGKARVSGTTKVSDIAKVSGRVRITASVLICNDTHLRDGLIMDLD